MIPPEQAGLNPGGDRGTVLGKEQGRMIRLEGTEPTNALVELPGVVVVLGNGSLIPDALEPRTL
eukprot:15131159-Alexandrium_andersonii.AAC.1